MDGSAGATLRWRLPPGAGRALGWLSVGPALAILLAQTAPWWPGQLCANWTLHAVALLLPALMAFGRRPVIGAALLTLIALACLPWIRAGVAPRAPTPPAAGVAATVVSANVAAWNHWRPAAIARAAARTPDLLCLIEVRPDDRDSYRSDGRWPFQVWATYPSGIALLSALPIVERHIHGAQVNPLLEAIVVLDGRRVRVIAVHTRSPTRPGRQRERARELDMVAHLVAQDDLPALVVGDFNLVVGDPEWRGFAAASALLRPQGHEPTTWPSPFGAFALGIDHLLVRGLAVSQPEPVWLPGSDHRGLAARVAFPTP